MEQLRSALISPPPLFSLSLSPVFVVGGGTKGGEYYTEGFNKFTHLSICHTVIITN